MNLPVGRNRGELGSQVGLRHGEFNRGELWQEDWLKCYFWWRTPPGDLYSNQWYCETVLPFVKVITIIRVCKRMSRYASKLVYIQLI